MVVGESLKGIDKMLKYLVICIVGIVVTAIGLILRWNILMVPGTILMVAGFFFAAMSSAREDAEENAEIMATDGRLRSDLIAAQKLALAKLGNADEETRSQVAELLVEAGKHLGSPETNSRLVTSSSYLIDWNVAGLDLVTQANCLIYAHMAKGAPKA